MKKEDAIKILTMCAKGYQKNLENRNLLFIFQNTMKLDCFETLFLARHYLHLTGIEILANKIKSSTDFYNMCITGQLSPSSFKLAEDGTTDLKLSILNQIINIHKTAKMMGDYNNSKSKLITDKITGNINACLGFVKEGNYYVPNTALREDTRNLIGKSSRIVSIISKHNNYDKYCNVEYIAKKFDFDDVYKNDKAKNLIHIPEVQ